MGRFTIRRSAVLARKDSMDAANKYAQRLARIEKDFSRDGDLPRAVERVAWSAGIPIWWLEEFAPNWAQQAESREADKQDADQKRLIKAKGPRNRSGGSVLGFRISLPRSSIRDD